MSLATARTWRVYPNILAQHGRAVARDGAVLPCLILSASVAIRVDDDIAGLDRLDVGIAQPGSSVQRDFGTAATAVGDVPTVGGQLSTSLRSAGAGTGGATARSAQQADRDIGRAATLIGWLIFLLPASSRRSLPAAHRRDPRGRRRPPTLITSLLIPTEPSFAKVCNQVAAFAVLSKQNGPICRRSGGASRARTVARRCWRSVGLPLPAVTRLSCNGRARLSLHDRAYWTGKKQINDWSPRTTRVLHPASGIAAPVL
jgi:hypothetical protein